MISEVSKSPASGALPDFSDEAVRRRLGPSALMLARKILDVWQVSDEEAKQLLALPPASNVGDLDSQRLSEEQLLRISYLIGIYEALHTVHARELADQWVHLPNTNPLFGGQSPLFYMIHEGINALRDVRRLLDGRAQGR